MGAAYWSAGDSEVAEADDGAIVVDAQCELRVRGRCARRQTVDLDAVEGDHERRDSIRALEAPVELDLDPGVRCDEL